ncbi:MAG: 4Fe-4S binding protein [Chloroflexi bacterium]|nr:4Fe-4S binding protein [Chloroflexota bacterium]
MSEPTPIEKTVLVLGSAPEAERVACELATLGYEVWRARELASLQGQVGAFTAQVVDDGGVARTLNVAALVVATGNERYYPAEVYGLAPSATVWPLGRMRAWLDERIAAEEPLSTGNLTVAMVLDWGGLPTSREMAAEALGVASRLREEQGAEVYLFYRDLRVDSPGFEALTRQMRQQGVLFARYGEEARLAAEDDGATISYIEGQIRVDLLVLPEAVRPRADTAWLAQAMKVHLGADGYFEDINIHQVRSGISNRKGIFFAGRCYMDCPAGEALADALQAAANVDALLGRGYLEPEPVIAHVDSSKCVRCLTCVRTCPHAAVEVVEYPVGRNGDASAGVVAALVSELACQGCGACVGNCPVRAIELVGQALPAWMQAAPAVSA